MVSPRLQMDIKIEGINEEIMEIALEQALAARLHILSEMNTVISSPRQELSDSAPQMHTMKIDPDKIRDVIGKGGATIRSITEETGASIDLEDDGTVKIFADNGDGLAGAIKKIEEITAEAEIGKTYKGKVVRLAEFGAFVNFLPGKDGLVHISQIAHERVKKVEDYLEEGQEVDVLCLDIDNRGRIKLSIKELLDKPEAAEDAAEASSEEQND